MILSIVGLLFCFIATVIILSVCGVGFALALTSILLLPFLLVFGFVICMIGIIVLPIILITSILFSFVSPRTALFLVAAGLLVYLIMKIF